MTKTYQNKYNIVLKKVHVKKELLILIPFFREPWKEFILSEILKFAKTSARNYTYLSLKKFVSQNILIETKRGNMNFYKLNLLEPKVVSYASVLESVQKEERDIPYKNLDTITSKLKSYYYSLAITGSFAKGEQKASSDLDIAFIIPNDTPKKEFEIALKEGDLVVPEIHGFVFTQGEYYNMLINDDFNFGKEIARKHILYYGAEPYYKILFEAIKHGFKG